MMLKNTDIHIRDPFVLPIMAEKLYYLYGATGLQAWTNAATGIDLLHRLRSAKLERPFPGLPAFNELLGRS
jgi:arabinan endo-1,5-alpha-L-arabinosidase